MLDRLNGNSWYDTLTNKNRTRKIFLPPDLYSTYPLVLFRQKWTYERLVRWTAITDETNSYQIVFVVNKKKIVLSSEKLETKLKRWTRGKGIVYNISRSWLRIYIDIYIVVKMVPNSMWSVWSAVIWRRCTDVGGGPRTPSPRDARHNHLYLLIIYMITIVSHGKYNLLLFQLVFFTPKITLLSLNYPI